LTKAYICAKIGIVKVIFIAIEKYFHIFTNSVKIMAKNENNFQNTGKEARIEQDFTTGSAYVQRHGQVREESR
jgi:hypothetical protein